MEDEREWISRGGESEEFKEYENKVERFLASLNQMIAQLYQTGHIDEHAHLSLGKLAAHFQSEC
jgi:hypothetical protein